MYLVGLNKASFVPLTRPQPQFGDFGLQDSSQLVVLLSGDPAWVLQARPESTSAKTPPKAREDGCGFELQASAVAGQKLTRFGVHSVRGRLECGSGRSRI